jgi:site-specific recombinase XerD
MDLSQTIIGHRTYSNQIGIFPKPVQISVKEPVIQTLKPKNRQIKKCIKRLSAKKLFGHPHVKRYLYDQYRRGCRPNTIRSNFESIILFITYLKNNDRTCLEAVTRDDLGGFIEQQQDQDLKPNTVSTRTIFRRYIEKAGLTYKGYTLHCLRHTFASELLNAGMRLECVQQLLGHSSIEMTRRYARLTDNTRKEEYFKAMAIIESGGVNGHYQCHH